jgi:hypothetical protein
LQILAELTQGCVAVLVEGARMHFKHAAAAGTGCFLAHIAQLGSMWRCNTVLLLLFQHCWHPGTAAQHNPHAVFWLWALSSKQQGTHVN